MTAKEYNATLKKLGLTAYGAARYLGVSRRQSLRYASGEQPISRTIELLLRMYLAHGLPPVGNSR
jgi:hypothetical protein